MAKEGFLDLYDVIAKGLAKPDSKTNIDKAVARYIDVNTEKLTTQGPSGRPTFKDSDKQVLYQASHIDVDEVREHLKKMPNIKSQWRIMNEPFNATSALAIRYYTLKKDIKTTTSVLVYLMLSMYPSLHFKYFKFDPNEQTMNYTINNMSNKYKIKQVNSIYEALVETVVGSYEHHKQRIIRGNDKDIVDFVMDIKTRMNSLMKNIANEYYDNNEKGLYMNLDSNNFEPDNYHEADSNMFAVQRITDKVTLRLVSNGPNMQNVSLAAKWCQVSVSELRNYTNQLITGEHREEIRSIIESVLFLYLYNEKHNIEDIRDNQFIVYCLDTYKKSNTNDENITKIKAILDDWLKDVGAYKKTQRVATLNNFRRALYIFFVISIMHYA